MFKTYKPQIIGKSQSRSSSSSANLQIGSHRALTTGQTPLLQTRPRLGAVSVPNNNITTSSNNFSLMPIGEVIKKLFELNSREVFSGKFLNNLEIYSFCDEGEVTKCECYSAQPRNEENIVSKFEAILLESGWGKPDIEKMAEDNFGGDIKKQVLQIISFDVQNNKGGSYIHDALFLMKGVDDRTVVHEFGHYQQNVKYHDIYGQMNSDFREVHNIILNENSRPELEPSKDDSSLYYTITNRGRQEYYRIKYRKDDIIQSYDPAEYNEGKIEEDIKRYMGQDADSYINMYQEMKKNIDELETKLEDNHYRTCLISRLKNFMIWGLYEQIEDLFCLKFSQLG